MSWCRRGSRQSGEIATRCMEVMMECADFCWDFKNYYTAKFENIEIHKTQTIVLIASFNPPMILLMCVCSNIFTDIYRYEYMKTLITKVAKSTFQKNWGRPRFVFFGLFFIIIKNKIIKFDIFSFWFLHVKKQLQIKKSPSPLYAHTKNRQVQYVI